jgi:O-antigen/teichoic acid export membrane protein
MLKVGRDMRPSVASLTITMLVSGTVLSQAISFLTLPIITRLFSPENFETLANFTSISIIVSLAGALALDQAIPIAGNDEDAVALGKIATLVSSLISTIVGIISILLVYFDISLLNINDSAMLLIGPCCLISCVGAVGESFIVRSRRYRILVSLKFIQTIVVICTQIILGFSGYKDIGLIVGYMLLGVPGILIGFVLQKNELYPRVNSNVSLVNVFRIYSRYPKFTAPELLTNAMAVYLPIIIVSQFTNGELAAYIALGLRILQAPLQVVARAISQTYQPMMLEWNEAGQLKQESKKLAYRMMMFIIVPLIIYGLLLYKYSGVIFGDDWAYAGNYLILLIPSMALYYLSLPIIPAAYISTANRYVFFGSLTAAIFRICSTIISVNFDQNVVAYTYAVSGIIYYAIIIYFCFLSINKFADSAVSISKE